MIKYVFLILSFVAELLMLNYFSNSYLLPMFTVISIAMVYSLFKDKKKYNIVVIILSLFYGLIFLNNIFLGFLIFFIIKEFVFLMNRNINMNLFKFLILGIFCIVISDAILYLFLLMPFYFIYFVYIVFNSLLVNVLFILVMYPIINFCSKW